MTTRTTLNFATWLRNQTPREDMIGELAKSVRADPRGHLLESARDVSQRLNQNEAPWEFHDALEQAQGEWEQAVA